MGETILTYTLVNLILKGRKESLSKFIIHVFEHNLGKCGESHNKVDTSCFMASHCLFTSNVLVPPGM